MGAKETVENAINNNKIVIFSKSYCPYCSSAKSMLISDFSAIKDQIYITELDTIGEEGSAIQAYLAEKTGQRTVPNIFINKQHIGGNDAVQSLKSQDKLAGLVAV